MVRCRGIASLNIHIYCRYWKVWQVTGDSTKWVDFFQAFSKIHYMKEKLQTESKMKSGSPRKKKKIQICKFDDLMPWAILKFYRTQKSLKEKKPSEGKKLRNSITISMEVTCYLSSVYMIFHILIWKCNTLAYGVFAWQNSPFIVMTKPLIWIYEILKIGTVYDKMNCLIFTGLEY